MSLSRKSVSLAFVPDRNFCPPGKDPFYHLVYCTVSYICHEAKDTTISIEQGCGSSVLRNAVLQFCPYFYTVRVHYSSTCTSTVRL
jgi:hypothetical protein